MNTSSLEIWQGEEIEYAVAPTASHDSGECAKLLYNVLQKGNIPLPGPSLFIPLRANRKSEFLWNGGRVYLDEITQEAGRKYVVLEAATPECPNAYELSCYDKVAERLPRLAADQLQATRGERVHCYKTQVARYQGAEGVTYTTRGLHESFQVSRRFLEQGLALLVPFLVLRPLFCGAGGYIEGRYSLCPRHHFLKEVYSTVTHPTPMLCLRHESHARTDRFRLQILSGEGTRLQATTFLRASLTSYVLLAIEGGFLNSVPELSDPLRQAIKLAESDPLGDFTLELASGKSIGAVDYFLEYYRPALDRLFSQRAAGARDRSALELIDRVAMALQEKNLEAINRIVEWVFKLDVFEENGQFYFDFDAGVENRKEALNFAYTAVTDTFFETIEREFGLERILGEETIQKNLLEPPRNSRGWLRRAVAERYPNQLEDLTWDSLTLAGKRFFFPDPGFDEEITEKVLQDLNGVRCN